MAKVTRGQYKEKTSFPHFTQSKNVIKMCIVLKSVIRAQTSKNKFLLGEINLTKAQSVFKLLLR